MAMALLLLLLLRFAGTEKVYVRYWSYTCTEPLVQQKAVGDLLEERKVITLVNVCFLK